LLQIPLGLQREEQERGCVTASMVVVLLNQTLQVHFQLVLAEAVAIHLRHQEDHLLTILLASTAKSPEPSCSLHWAQRQVCVCVPQVAGWDLHQVQVVLVDPAQPSQRRPAASRAGKASWLSAGHG